MDPLHVIERKDFCTNRLSYGSQGFNVTRLGATLMSIAIRGT